MSTEQPAQLHWFKSSYSGDEGGECVEVAMGPATAPWFKSSYSSGEGGECVEVAATPARVHIRDSKHRGGPQLDFTPAAWAGFVGGFERSDLHSEQ